MAQRAYAMLSCIAPMSAIWCGLLAWQWAASRLGCIASVLCVLPLWGILTLAASEVALLRRYAFIAQYLRPQGMLARLLRRKTVLLLWQGTKALFLALVLLVSALLFEGGQWRVLLADIVLMATLVGVIGALLHGEVKPDYSEPLARHWAHWVNAIVLWLTSVVLTFFSAHEDYTGMVWEEVVRFGASKVTVACDALAVLARINAVSEALAWWGAQNVLSGWERPAQVLMAWTAFIASFGVSFLIAWAYSRALAGILSKPWRLVASNRNLEP